MQVGMIGLGRMGANMVRRLMRGGHRCVVHDVSKEAVQVLVERRGRLPGPPAVGDAVRVRRPPREAARSMSAPRSDAVVFFGASGDPVEAAWAVVQPILGSATPVHEYEPGSWGPPDAAALTAEIGGWQCPTC